MVSVNSHVKTLSLYNFIRGFEWAYRRGGGGLISGEPISGVKEMSRNDEVKRI